MSNETMGAPSSAIIFWEGMPADDTEALSWLQKLVDEESEENEWRDFKKGIPFFNSVLSDAERKKKEDELRAIWSECLGAFANNVGGVLIWGIKAPLDKAKELSLCPDALRLAKRLESLKNDTVEPPVPGVQIRAVVKPGSSEGFVACLIPESPFRPHRSKHAARDFYIRMGASSQNLGTSLLRALFAERRIPRGVPLVRGSIVKADGGMKALQCTVSLEHFSGPSARELRVISQLRGRAGLGPFTYYSNQDEWKEDRWANTTLDAVRTLHCGEKINLYRNVTCPPRPAFDEEEILDFEFTVLSLDQPPFRYVCNLSVRELSAGEITTYGELAGLD